MSKVSPVYGKDIVVGLTKEWYVREFNSTTFIYGPIDYITADRQARKISKTSTLGVTELVTYNKKGELLIVATYLRGKKRYQGLRSTQASRYNLPPTV